MPEIKYEMMPHGKNGFRIAVFSEKIYPSDPHYHDEYAIFYLAEGKMRFGIEEDEFIISAGDIVFVEPGQCYYAFKTEDNDEFHYYSVVFDISILGAEDDPCFKILKNIRVNRFLTLSPELLELMPHMRRWDIEKNFGNEVMLKSAFYSIFAHIIQTSQYTKLSDLNMRRSDVASEAVDSVIKYIEEHYKEKITVDDLVERINYSKSHLMRIFKQSTGMSVTDYINKFRVEKACLELIYSKKNITEIAASNGFNTVQYFIKVFHDFSGRTPGEFRKTARL